MAKTIEINTEYITLGQLLKEIGLISTGGMAKWFLSEHQVLLNNEIEQRRGKKLYNGDRLEIEEFGEVLIVSTQ